MKKSSKKNKKNQANKDSQEESQEPESLLASIGEEEVDTFNFLENHTLQISKRKDIPPDHVIGAHLTKTKQPFFYIHNDIVFTENEEVNDTQIADVFGHKCDIGQVSFTDLVTNGETITLPTDLVSSFCHSSLTTYFNNNDSI